MGRSYRWRITRWNIQLLSCRNIRRSFSCETHRIVPGLCSASQQELSAVQNRASEWVSWPCTCRMLGEARYYLLRCVSLVSAREHHEFLVRETDGGIRKSYLERQHALSTSSSSWICSGCSFQAWVEVLNRWTLVCILEGLCILIYLCSLLNSHLFAAVLLEAHFSKSIVF